MNTPKFGSSEFKEAFETAFTELMVHFRAAAEAVAQRGHVKFEKHWPPQFDDRPNDLYGAWFRLKKVEGFAIREIKITPVPPHTIPLQSFDEDALEGAFSRVESLLGKIYNESNFSEGSSVARLDLEMTRDAMRTLIRFEF